MILAASFNLLPTWPVRPLPAPRRTLAPNSCQGLGPPRFPDLPRRALNICAGFRINRERRPSPDKICPKPGETWLPQMGQKMSRMGQRQSRFQKAIFSLRKITQKMRKIARQMPQISKDDILAAAHLNLMLRRAFQRFHCREKCRDYFPCADTLLSVGHRINCDKQFPLQFFLSFRRWYFFRHHQARRKFPQIVY